MAQPTSGTTLFDPALSDLVLEAFSRIQIYPASLTANHMLQARMSANLLLAEWAVEPGPNLWQQELRSVPLVQGQPDYAVGADVIGITDYFIRSPVTVATKTLTDPFTTASDSRSITVAQAAHGLTLGSYVNVLTAATVGGIPLSGLYPVETIPDANTYTILAQAPATNSVTGGGAVSVRTESAGAGFTDLPVIPMSRTDYAAQPQKSEQGPPTNVFFLRTINPRLTFWLTPDGNGPYVVYYWAITQIQDASLPNGATLDLPYRFFDAFAAGLAARLARKFPPPPASGVTVNDLKLEAAEAWAKASNQDTEEGVTLGIVPGLSGYYR